MERQVVCLAALIKVDPTNQKPGYLPGFFFLAGGCAGFFLPAGFIGLWPAILAPRKAASKRALASSLLYSASILGDCAMSETPRGPSRADVDNFFHMHDLWTKGHAGSA